MASSLLKLYQSFNKLPFGDWMFSKAVCFKAPYFSSIKPKITMLTAGSCSATLPKRRAVHNHIGTVHAIAQCNLAELVAGLATDATVPSSHRWIPKGMTVNYLKKAKTDLSAVAYLTIPEPIPDKHDCTVDVKITDKNELVVFSAKVTMYITSK